VITESITNQTQTWQDALYGQLSAQNSEAGYLLTTPTGGVCKTDTVVIPALGLGTSGPARRLFLICHDGVTLDHHLFRLVPLLRESAITNEVPRTLYLDTPETEETGQTCVRFCPDGSEDRTIALNPLEADVDVVLTTLSRFGDLFFGAGGVHGLPLPFMPDDGSHVRRDLFFFDEAHDYDHDSFLRFQRLVKFLFAQDKDIVVASSTMPAHYRDDLSFLDPIEVGKEHALHHSRTITWMPAQRPLLTIKNEVRRAFHGNEKVFAVLERTVDAEQVYERIVHSVASHGQRTDNVFLYHHRQPSDVRRAIYARLTELDKQDQGYVLMTTGRAIETTDLDATVLVSSFCPPENLILRAGRCNRRIGDPTGRLIIVGEELDRWARPLSARMASEYTDALAQQQDSPFDADYWKRFI
jgi:CRISPR-associated endonuclease/helicase Cas3